MALPTLGQTSFQQNTKKTVTEQKKLADEKCTLLLESLIIEDWKRGLGNEPWTRSKL